MVSLRRKGALERRSPDVILILSQDTGGVLQYLSQTYQDNSTEGNVSVLVRGAGVSSKTLLNYAKSALKGRERQDLPAANYVILLFDRDSDPHFDQVLNEVRELDNVEALPSIPCFEYYFILHFEEIRPAMAGPDAVIAVLKGLPGFEKYQKGRNGVPVARLSANSIDANERAARIRRACAADGSQGPQTYVDLISEIISSARTYGLAHVRATKKDRAP